MPTTMRPKVPQPDSFWKVVLAKCVSWLWEHRVLLFGVLALSVVSILILSVLLKFALASREDPIAKQLGTLRGTLGAAESQLDIAMTDTRRLQESRTRLGDFDAVWTALGLELFRKGIIRDSAAPFLVRNTIESGNIPNPEVVPASTVKDITDKMLSVQQQLLEQLRDARAQLAELSKPKEPTTLEHVRLWSTIGISALLLPLAIYLSIKKPRSPNAQKIAFTIIGAIIGYWLPSSSS